MRSYLVSAMVSLFLVLNCASLFAADVPFVIIEVNAYAIQEDLSEFEDSIFPWRETYDEFTRETQGVFRLEQGQRVRLGPIHFSLEGEQVEVDFHFSSMSFTVPKYCSGPCSQKLTFGHDDGDYPVLGSITVAY